MNSPRQENVDTCEAPRSNTLQTNRKNRMVGRISLRSDCDISVPFGNNLAPLDVPDIRSAYDSALLIQQIVSKLPIFGLGARAFVLIHTGVCECASVAITVTGLNRGTMSNVILQAQYSASFGVGIFPGLQEGSSSAPTTHFPTDDTRQHQDDALIVCLRSRQQHSHLL